MPAGAIRTEPGSTASPSCASRTGMALRASSRSARDFVKPRGMCWTTRTAAGKPAGRPATTTWRAVGPPVEAATTTHSAAGAPGTSRAPLRAGLGRACTRAPPSARTFATSSSARLSMLMGCTDDLSTKSMAPSSSPRSVTSAPSWVRVDISRTGTGCSAMRRSRVSRPPRRGILTSRVTTSGRSSRAFARPSSPSAAKPTTSMSSTVPSIRSMALRTNAESSTTRTRMRRVTVTGEAPPASGTRWPPGSGSGRRRSTPARATPRGRGRGSRRARAPGGRGSPPAAPPRPRSR